MAGGTEMVVTKYAVDNTNSCGYCGARQSFTLYPTYSISNDNFLVNRCCKCNAVFIAPGPTPQQLNAAYDDSYYGQTETKFVGRIEGLLDFFRSARARMLNRYINFFLGASDLISQMQEFVFKKQSS